MPGYDPVLDGTASPSAEMKVRERKYTDGSYDYQVTYPDGDVAVYEDLRATGRAMGAWVEAHPDAYGF